MKFIPFVLAVIIGKIINYVPLIFLGKWLFQLLHIVK
jgi:membrane protein YqaA with SNARE-associated domain